MGEDLGEKVRDECPGVGTLGHPRPLQIGFREIPLGEIGLCLISQQLRQTEVPEPTIRAPNEARKR